MTISPLSESGNPVDWWFIYKVPRAAQENISGIGPATGYEYAYYDNVVDTVQASPYEMDGGKGALNLTLDAIFDGQSDSTGWILYNDERPPEDELGQDNSELGHTKGALLFDTASNTAIWLLHSWPKYVWPDAPEMPTPMYGQTFMCLALTVQDIDALAAQMINYQQPQVFASKIPAGLDPTSSIVKLSQGVNINSAGDSNTIDLTTRGGLNFKVVAKNRNWNKDFWNDLVVDQLNIDINVETWIRGGAKVIPDTLDEAKVHTTSDIKFITLQAIGLPWAWPEVDDHAKWGISHPGEGDWICVGDINRMISQRKRGGCTIAFQDADLWDLLNKTDLINAPAGLTREEAVQQVQRTHEVQVVRNGVVTTTKAPGTFGKKALPTPLAVSARAAIQQAQRSRAPLAQLSHRSHKNLQPAGTSTYGSILGTINKSTEKQITGQDGVHWQFYVQMYGTTQYQVDTNVQSKNGSEVGVYVADEALPAVSTQPPFGPVLLSFYPNASLSYQALGLNDADFVPLSDSRLETQLEGALNESAYVSVYGFVFDDGGPDGKGIHDNHFNPGKLDQDGGIAVYMINQQGQPIRRWFFFKFQSDSIP
jgi:deoxyribonuclease-2